MGLLVSLITVIAASQTDGEVTVRDWSGGPGHLGPTPIYQWGNTFYEEIFTDYSSSPGTLRLEHGLLLHDVSTDTTYASDDVAVLDIDLDGDSDLMVLEYSTLWWFENFDGAGIYWIGHCIGVLPSAPGGGSSPADMDGDGDSDVQAFAGHRVSWFENEGAGASWQRHDIIETDVDLSEAVPADIDGDGDPDIVIYGDNPQWDYVLAWIRNQSGAWSPPIIVSDDPAVFGGEAADLDSDGDVDLLGKSLWYENTGSGISWAQHEYGSTSCSVFSSLDADQDADLDVLAAVTVSYQFHYLVWFENLDGAGTDWQENTITALESSCINAISCYLNSDSYPDAFFVSSDDGLGWALNSGDTEEWEIGCIAPQDPLYNSLSAGDLNADSRTDLAFTHYSGLVGWYDLSTYRPYSCLTSSIAYAYPLIEWALMECESDLPPGTSVYFRVRCSDDPGDMGEWSDELYPPCYLSFLPAFQNYFQYQICMETSSPYSTPLVESISLCWTEMGTGDDPIPDVPGIILDRNPLRPGDAVSVLVTADSRVDLAIYDLSGRCSCVLENSWRPAGTSSYIIPKLPSGIYVLVLRSGDMTDARSVVLVGK